MSENEAETASRDETSSGIKTNSSDQKSGQAVTDPSDSTDPAADANVPAHSGPASYGNPASASDDGITIIMVGDILLHTPVAESGLRADGSYCFDALFTNVVDVISSADLALVNQEVIIGGSELGVSGYPAFNAPFELGDALINAGFDVILHATNHALDKGAAGVRNCAAYWATHPEIAVLGIHADPPEDHTDPSERIFLYEQNGIRIAILNYTYGTNGIPMPASMPDAVDLLEEETVCADLALAEELADFTIVCPHWGTEYQLVPSAEQEYWAELFLRNGADLCIGTHPHVIEPIEWLTDEEGHRMLVYYSLGNFVNWTSSSGAGIANRMVGGMATVTVGRPSAADAVCITDYGIEPLVCHLSDGTDGVSAWFLSDYTDEMAAEHAILSQDPAFSREYCVRLCNEVWGDLFSFE